MKIFSLVADRWKMDGGVAFGVVPYSIWSKNYPPDDNNMIDICTRCLLIDDGKDRILIDVGMGDKRGDKYYGYKYLSPDAGIEKALKEIGYSPKEISKVIFTHLHDDHCGAAITASNAVLFPNAVFFCSQSQFEWALSPSARDGAAYFPDNYMPLYENGLMNFLGEGSFNDYIEIRIMNGHTEGQIIPIIKYKEHYIAYAADFIPSYGHIPLPYVPSVDMQPLITMQEKEVFLEEAYQKNFILMFEHDNFVEACYLQKNDKGVRGGNIITIANV
jgi:glyoxylase-like metal-dependent hydrolase (beta-lactamase superfamily II)